MFSKRVVNLCASTMTSASSASKIHSRNFGTVFGRIGGMQRNSLNNGSLMDSNTPLRRLNIHEYQSVELMKKYKIPTANCFVAFKPVEAEEAAEKLQGPDYVVKAQVLAGGRGKGKFTSGFKGGVHSCTSPLEARGLAAKMLGQTLVTKQTGAAGKPCSAVMVAERLYLRRETYFAILMDRASQGPVMVGSSEGGMDIEAVASATPDKIHSYPVDITKGPAPEDILKLVKQMGFSGPGITQAVNIINNLYKMFIATDCTQIEINPMAETHDGRVLCIDAKLNFDSNAGYRQKEIFSLWDPSQEDPREVEAAKHDLNYVGLDGQIGCLVNGAGLAMATMDAIKLNGGNPANFLDIGGGANVTQVTAAFKLLNSDSQVKAILVNIFGGIMRCDVLALGLISAINTLGIKKPIVVRLAGTNVEQAKKLIEESGLRMLTADDLGEAAEKAVRVVEIIKLAHQAHLDINFEMPL